MIILNSVVLPAPLGPMMPDDAAARQVEVEVLEQQVVAETLGKPSRGRPVAQGRPGAIWMSVICQLRELMMTRLKMWMINWS